MSSSGTGSEGGTPTDPDDRIHDRPGPDGGSAGSDPGNGSAGDSVNGSSAGDTVGSAYAGESAHDGEIALQGDGVTDATDDANAAEGTSAAPAAITETPDHDPGATAEAAAATAAPPAIGASGEPADPDGDRAAADITAELPVPDAAGDPADPADPDIEPAAASETGEPSASGAAHEPSDPDPAAAAADITAELPVLGASSEPAEADGAEVEPAAGGGAADLAVSGGAGEPGKPGRWPAFADTTEELPISGAAGEPGDPDMAAASADVAAELEALGASNGFDETGEIAGADDLSRRAESEWEGEPAGDLVGAAARSSHQPAAGRSGAPDGPGAGSTDGGQSRRDDPDRPDRPERPGSGGRSAAGGRPAAAVPAAPAKGAEPRRPGRKPRSKAMIFLRRVAFVVLGLIGFAVLGFGIAYLLTPIPEPQAAAQAQGPVFYYSDGKTPIAQTGINREAVDLDKVPKVVRDAVIAAENRSFYQDPGVSVRGTARAFWSTVSGEQVQGGSTITQQMVRNYYSGVGQERSISRKLKEVMVSLKVGNERDKDWILTQYLNTIYFGRDAYGIQAAAKAYYNKDVGDLAPEQGAYLAAAIQQPTPFGDPTGSRRGYAEQRWRSVIDGMVKMGTISAADAAQMRFPTPPEQRHTDTLKGQTGYMVNIAKQELRDRRGFSEDEVNRGGLRITTTFDKRLMDAAERAVKSNLPPGLSKKVLTGMVSVDPKTGQVLAFYGGKDYLKRQLSSSFGSYAQAASGFKPLVLAAALNDGLPLTTTVDGSSPQYFNGTRIQNNSGRSFGQLNLIGATENSVNTAYVNLGLKTGLDKVTRMAEEMGVPAKQLAENGKVPTLSLGVTRVSPVQLAGAYGTFAAEGVHRTPYVVKSVTDGDGDTKRYTQKGERAFSKQVANDATYAMSRVVQGGTGTGAQLPDGRDVAGKTGTGVAGRAIWFNGFIPQMTTSVGIFRVDNKPLSIPGYSIFGGVLPAQVWRSYMSEAVQIKNYSPVKFAPPSQGIGADRSDDGFNPLAPRPENSPPPRTTRPPTIRPTPPEEEPSLPIPTVPTTPPGDGGEGDGEGGGDRSRPPRPLANPRT